MKKALLLMVVTILAVACGQPTPSPPDPVAPLPALAVRAPMLSAVEVRQHAAAMARKAATAADAATSVGASHAPQAKTLMAARSATPSSWLVPNWYIDGANSSGCASDTNSGQSATCGAAGTGPLLTYGELKARWGTVAPQIGQLTQVTFVSSQAAGDPVVARPTLLAGGQFDLLGSATQVASGTIAAVTAKNRATGQLLTVDFGAGFVCASHVRQLVTNTTHASKALIDSCTSTSVAVMTAPQTAAWTPPSTWPTTFTNVDTWAVGDAYTVSSLPSVQLIDFTPTTAALTAQFAANAHLARVSIQGTALSLFRLGPSVASFAESTCDAAFEVSADPFTPTGTNVANVAFSNGVSTAALSPGSQVVLWGGEIRQGSGEIIFQGQIDNDIIFHGAAILVSGTPATAISGAGAYFDSFVLIIGPVLQPSAAPMWGPATVVVQSQSSLSYFSPAASNILTTGSLVVNLNKFSTTGCTINTAVDPAAWHCGISITAAHLDACPASTTALCGLASDPISGAAFMKRN